VSIGKGTSGARGPDRLLRVDYSSEHKLDSAAEQILTRALGDRLGIRDLQLLRELQEAAPAEPVPAE
jgi:hypothetical protein